VIRDTDCSPDKKRREEKRNDEDNEQMQMEKRGCGVTKYRDRESRWMHEIYPQHERLK
jgi:hypothetical protein